MIEIVKMKLYENNKNALAYCSVELFGIRINNVRIYRNTLGSVSVSYPYYKDKCGKTREYIYIYDPEIAEAVYTKIISAYEEMILHKEPSNIVSMKSINHNIREIS